MRLTSAHLRPGMWVEYEDDDPMILIERDSDGVWAVSYMGGTVEFEDEDFDNDADTGPFYVMDHPANVGPLFELCREVYGPTCFFDWTRSNVRPWRVFPGSGAAPVACEPTLCAALLAALEAAP